MPSHLTKVGENLRILTREFSFSLLKVGLEFNHFVQKILFWMPLGGYPTAKAVPAPPLLLEP